MKLLLIVVLAMVLNGQTIRKVLRRPTGCSSPVGTTFTEPFDSLTNWTLHDGSAPIISASPGTPTANTACANSARFTVDGRIDTGAFTEIPSNTVFDVEVGLYIATVGTISYPAVINLTDAVGNKVATIFFDSEPGTNFATFGGTDASNTYGNQQTLSNSSWHTLSLHVNGASSTYTVDGGTAYGFTAGVTTTDKISLLGFSVADFYIGWLRVST